VDEMSELKGMDQEGLERIIEIKESFPGANVNNTIRQEAT